MTDVFITENFLLANETAVELYQGYAKDQPIIDYHNHLSPAEIADDQQWENLTQIWLYGDHYKWRAMRTNGVDERYCTGDASDWEKFAQWAETVPKTLRNPLYQWTHLELKRPFGIGDRLLNPRTAKGIWDECNEKLAAPEFSARGILEYWNVKLVCTTDDPADSLEHHRKLAAGAQGDSKFKIKVLPAWRPDKAMAVESPVTYNAYLDRLGAAADVDIKDYSSFMDALNQRHDFFHAAGCRLSDHGIETAYAAEYRPAEIESIFAKVRGGAELAPDEIEKFKSAMLYEFGLMDHAKGWRQQYHLGALRNNNTRLLGALGPDTGFDSIGDFEIARPLARFLDRLDREDRLAPTVLYNLNPRDNELMAAMIGNFQDGSVPGKIQFGSAWWFLDQKDGIEKHLEAISNMSLLSRFIGMLTDSRSFLSFSRHDYFRRILCSIVGRDIEQGLLPSDLELAGGMVADICFANAREYFGFELDG